MYFIPVYILILFAVILIDYFAGLQIARVDARHKKKWLLLSLLGNLSILFFFKYFNFFVDNINHLSIYLPFLKTRLKHLDIILPIGLSFHTFQAISYTVEVYRSNQKPEKHLGIYALYVMFFPQLVAGPIERPQNMLHQFHLPKKFDFKLFYSGLRLVLFGLFMKCFIADRLAIPVDTVFNHYKGQWSGLSIVVAMLFFAIQIYCDFAGYSYIAIGIARSMGFTLMQNFKQPYISKNVNEFWSRWHISLSTWFKDYVYIPLGGNRKANLIFYRNLLIVFALSGLWHGANYTFITWGLLHVFALIVFTVANKYFLKIKIPSIISVSVTFLFVSLAWIFFRATNIGIAKQMIATVFTSSNNYFKLYTSNDVHGLKGTFLGLPFWQFILTFMLLPLSFLLDYLVSNKKHLMLYQMPKVVQWSFYYLIIMAILFAGVFDTKQFIYFQF